jgi:hypothetical protein
MDESQEGADRVDHGEASLGEAQAENPPPDPEMLEDEPEPGLEPDDDAGEGDFGPPTES